MRQSPIPSSAVSAIVLAPNPSTETAVFAPEEIPESARDPNSAPREILEPSDDHYYPQHWGINE